MKRLTILAAALMAAGANAQHRGDPSLDEAARQWEERIKSSPTIQRMQSDIATLKAEHARMGVSSTKANPTYLYPDNTPISVSNGSVVIGGQPSSLCYVNEQGQTVCQNLPQAVQQPLRTVPVSAYSVPMAGQMSYMQSFGEGNCANGSCSTSSSGRRGLFGRRR
jgi:hypothetical protein